MDLSKDELAMSELPLNDKLTYAIEHNLYDYVAEFIKQKADVNHYNKGTFPLYKAIKVGNLDIVKLLVENGANIEFSGIRDLTNLVAAILENRPDIVKYLVGRGAKINTGFGEGDIPLIVAINRNFLDVVKVLVENGADINKANYYGNTPLKYAVSYIRNTPNKRTDVLKYLLEQGVYVNAKNNMGATVLKTSSFDLDDIPVFKLLLEYGADWKDIKNKAILQHILKEETAKVREELFQSYLAFKRVSPQYRADGKYYSEIPREIAKSLAYEKIYSELCTVIPRNNPPLKLLALAIVLDRDYNIEIKESWSELCQRVSRQIKPTYYPENKK
jgi:ankyrin repeat protein